MDARGRFHRRAHGRDPGAVPGDARHVPPLGPAAVAVHDDGDVFREPRGIQMAVDFRFLAIETRGYFVVQSGHTDLRLTQQGRPVQ